MKLVLINALISGVLLSCLSYTVTAATYPPNIDYGSQGQFVAKRGVSHGRTANLTPIGPVLINMPEAPGSSDAGGVTLEYYNTAWDLSDLTNPTLISRISLGLTQPIGAHGTTYHFDDAYAYLFTFGTEVGDLGGSHVRFDSDGTTSLQQLVPTDSYDLQPNYYSSGFAGEPLGYSMMTSPYNNRTYWEYGFDPSGLYNITNPVTFDTDPNNPTPWVGPLVVEWDHLRNTGVTGFTAYLGELMVVASDQQSTGLAIYNVAGVKAGGVPQLLSTFQPTLTEPSGNEIGIGGYWLEPYGANKMVWAARQRDEVTPVRTHPALYVVDFTDPSSPALTCELYFNQDHSDPSDGDSSSDPMYVNFQDNYAFVDHFKVDIPGCESAYLDDQNVSAEEFSSIVYKFEDRANHCDASQYFRPLGQVGVFGGYDGAAAAIVSYSGSEQMRDGASYMEVGAFDAWADAGFTDEAYPDSLLITHHYEPNLASSTREALSAGDEVLDVDAYWETGERVTFTLTAITVDERVNEQGMCFFVTSDEADTTPPYISGHRPLAGQTNYPVDAFIHMHIPETLRAETVTHAVTVTNLSTNQPVAFRHQLSHTGTLGVWPEENFDTDTSYQVDVSGIQDYMGNTIVPYRFTFATGDGTVAPPVDPEPPVAPAPSVETPYYPNHSGQIACESGDEHDSIWVLNPDNDSVSLLYTYTDPETFEQTVEVENDAFRFTDSTPSSVSRVADYAAVTYSDTDKIRFNRIGWWGTSPYTAWSKTFSYGSQPVASVAHDDMLYVALYGSGEIAKINTATKQIVSLLKVGSKPKAMALTSDGSRLLVTRFISDKDYAEVYDINTAGNMSFRDEEQPSIRINKVRVPDDIDHGSGVPNYLRSIVIGPNDDVAYVTANKANIDRGEFLNDQALDDDNTIRPMIAILDLINHEDANVNPNSRSNTIDLDNSADPSGITFLPDGVTRAHALQGNNVVEFNNLAQNTSLRASSGFAPQSMCTTVRSLYVKNFTDRTVSVIDTAGFMYDGRQNPNIQSLVTVEPENEVKTAEELRGLQVFYHARVPDISPEGYMSCASCHDDGGHDGMTWDLTHMGEGLRNTLSLRGTSGTRFGNLHWSSNFDEVQDFEVQLEHLNGAEGLIPGETFTGLVSPTSYTTAGVSDDLDALAAYVTSLGKSSVLRSPNSCSWGGRCSQDSHNGAWQFISHGCVDCHTGAAFRDGQSHDVGTIVSSSGQRLGSPLTEIRTPTLIELWDTAPYFHDGSAATLEEVMSRGDHAEMGLDDREQRNLIQYLLNLDRLDYIDDEEEPVPVDSEAPVITISGYEAGETANAQVGSSFTLPSATAVDGVDGDVDVSVSSDFDIGAANTYSVTYSATDNAGNEATATLTIVVSAVVINTPPVAADDQLTANIDEVLVLPFSSILDNDTDIDGDSLTVLIVDDWIGGVASLDSVARTITFIPDAGFSGVAQFTYAMTDGNDGGDYELMGFALVLINVGGQPPVPDNQLPTVNVEIPAFDISINESEPITLSAIATDFEDGDLGAGISWSSTIDGVLGSGATITANNLSAGTHIVSASVTDSGNVSVSATRTVTVVEVGAAALINPLFDSVDKVYTDLWESIVGVDGMPTNADRGDVDNASTLFFNHRSYLVSAARNYTVSGDIVWLNRAIAIANNYLNLRDDRYAATGGVVFTGTQTSYRAAVQPLLASATPAAVWSHDFTDTAVNSNPAVEGRRVQVLQNGRVLSALAEVVLAYHSHEPSGDYVAPQGADSGMLAGSYSVITQTLLTEINRTARIFDGQWQQDITGLDLSGDTNDGLWDVAGSYFYDKRQNLSLEGIDIDGVLPFNQVSGMLQARLVLNRFSDLDPLAVDHFNRWAAFHESVYASDDPTKANPGLSGNLFGLDTEANAYKWPYVAYQTLGEDIDHVIITLEVYMTAYRLALLERTLIQQLYRAVETVYPLDTDYYYDRIFEQGERYRSFRALPGTVNWLAEGTSLQENFATLANNLSSQGTLHIRDYEAVAAYYGSEQLSRFLAPVSNIPPEAQNNLFRVRINESIEISFGKITVNDVDEDGDSLLITSAAALNNGELAFDSATKTITFTPDANFIGEASFGYTITDGQNNSSATVTILVTSEPVITISGYSTGDTVYLAVGDTFTLPEVTAIDVEDGVRAVTSSGAVNTAVEGLYVLAYSASDTEGYIGTANLVVVVDGVGGEPVPQSSVRQFTFNHSLWQHDESSNAVTGYWVGEFATASQTSYAWNGQFGQLDYHGIGDGANLDVGPGPDLGSANSDDIFPTEETHFRDVNIDNVIIMPSNFDQGTAPLVDSGLISAAQRVVDYVVDEGTYGGQHSESMVYIYEHWQEASAAFPLTDNEWAEYHATTTQGYHQWFLNYQYQLMASRPEIDFRMIPVGPIIADILQNGALQASGFTFSELYDDGAPHGKPEIYFLAGLITYQAMYGQMASNSYVPPESNISPLIASEFPELNAFIWARLNYYNASGVRIWP